MNMKKHLFLLIPLVLAPFWGQGQTIDTNKARIDALFQEMHDAATWGLPATNGVQLGVAIFNGKGIKQFRVYTYLYDETNSWFGLYPPSGYRLSLSLKDVEGKEVEKTREGKDITKPVDMIVKAQMRIRTGRIQSRFDLLDQKYPERYENPFNLLDCFKVETSGTNTLTVGATLYKMNNAGNIYEISLPPVSIQVPITQTDIDSYRVSKNKLNSTRQP